MADEGETAGSLRAEIEHLRRLADLVTDERALTEMRKMIEELEQRLRELGQDEMRPVMAEGFADSFEELR
jgi:hypothetical protein